MKQEWIMPQASVDEFSTNEYLSTCWEVACNTVAANKYEINHKSGETHQVDHCGDPANQVLQDLNDDGIIDRMTEVGTDGLGNLRCTLYTNGTYNQKLNIGTVEPGDYIYWTTSVGNSWNKRVWHHQGQSAAISKTNPNRS